MVEDTHAKLNFESIVSKILQASLGSRIMMCGCPFSYFPGNVLSSYYADEFMMRIKASNTDPLHKLSFVQLLTETRPK